MQTVSFFCFLSLFSGFGYNISLNFEVKRNGRLIQLSKTEYALLEYLLRHAGKVLTKEQIISHVWDYEADILPNTVEV